ncbi:MAG: YihY/virulence factor BrkB family protein, partial [Muribaculaceae bacterium]|nr:YihY/virulence factor BrkB family protein [Muribaculaceae bacterium]
MKKDSDSIKQKQSLTIIDKAMRLWTYFNSGIWSDTRRSWWINALRTLNLSINSFLNRDIQSQACAMTYRTTLAVVPALAMLIGIGRGFGIQNVLEEELFRLFPAQHYAIKYGIQFVDSYLKQSSEGIFVGVGIAFLLWPLISLISNMEDTFNLIWGQVPSRSIWRKITDYTAMLLILPVLLICASGISLLLSSTLNSIFHFEFMTPVISILLEVASWIMTWLFFAAIYLLLPNTKVKIKNAMISGVLAGSAFIVLQWLFVSGTLYVTRYN